MGLFARWIVALLLVLSYPASAAFWRHSKVLRLIFGILTIVPFFWGMLALRARTMPITTTAARCGCCTS
nr:Phosphatidate cytidylyltransferase [Klebsiella pneumoniae]